ncbi:MAG: hypothetical protein EPO20_03925 [Betaproteobacteria bacterium]|nr:MAG: hypothetical protein EPO20_03925 [Betaproteobacteria bacterium]
MRCRVAIIGYGRLGRACAQAIKDCAELELAGIVRRGGHVRDLPAVRVALVCVPAAAALDVAAELLQQGHAIVECAALEGPALEAHYAELARVAARHRGRAMLGAGWDPGVLTLLRGAFEMLIPHGASEIRLRPALKLHHMTGVIPGVRAALAAERSAGAERRRYIYVELAPGARLDAVQAAITADPLYAGEPAEVFAVDSVAAMEALGQGLVFERRGSGGGGPHPSLLLEGRFDATQFAARAMLDGARRLPRLAVGAHPYHLSVEPRPTS